MTDIKTNLDTVTGTDHETDDIEEQCKIIEDNRFIESQKLSRKCEEEVAKYRDFIDQAIGIYNYDRKELGFVAGRKIAAARAGEIVNDDGWPTAPENKDVREPIAVENNDVHEPIATKNNDVHEPIVTKNKFQAFAERQKKGLYPRKKCFFEDLTGDLDSD